jgi:hypothetical protein
MDLYSLYIKEDDMFFEENCGYGNLGCLEYFLMQKRSYSYICTTVVWNIFLVFVEQRRVVHQYVFEINF